MIILDASFLIAQLDSADLHHARATQFLDEVNGIDEVMWGASPITLAEVLVRPARAGLLHAASTAVQRLGVDVVALTPDAPKQLAELRASTGLRMPDCCVLLALEQVGGELATFDERLAAAARDQGYEVRMG